MKKDAFTLLEMIFVVVISATLAMGSFKAMQALYLRSAKAKAVTDMTLRSQIVLDQIGVFLYNRIPNSVIGYDSTSGDCDPITELDDTKTYTVLEWLGTMDDELLKGDYDGFIDLGDSNRTSHILATKDISKDLNSTDVNLIFAGAFDEGAEESSKACGGAFGLHHTDSNLSFSVSIDNNSTKLTDDNDSQPEYIYEKYYLTNTAYAITRGENLTQNDLENNCDNGNYVFPPDINFTNTLFLFYAYQPFAGNTFCGDSSGTPDGNVSILATDVSAFEAIYVNDTIRINIDMNRSIRGSTPVRISKQKVVF